MEIRNKICIELKKAKLKTSSSSLIQILRWKKLKKNCDVINVIPVNRNRHRHVSGCRHEDVWHRPQEVREKTNPDFRWSAGWIRIDGIVLVCFENNLIVMTFRVNARFQPSSIWHFYGTFLALSQCVTLRLIVLSKATACKTFMLRIIILKSVFEAHM